jgi:hypothetical protein
VRERGAFKIPCLLCDDATARYRKSGLPFPSPTTVIPNPSLPVLLWPCSVAENNPESDPDLVNPAASLVSSDMFFFLRYVVQSFQLMPRIAIEEITA